MDGQLPLNVQSYRAFTYDWTGKPSEPPQAAVRANPAGGSIVYASWKGATEDKVDGPAPLERLSPVGSREPWADRVEKATSHRRHRPQILCRPPGRQGPGSSGASSVSAPSATTGNVHPVATSHRRRAPTHRRARHSQLAELPGRH